MSSSEQKTRVLVVESGGPSRDDFASRSERAAQAERAVSATLQSAEARASLGGETPIQQKRAEGPGHPAAAQSTELHSLIESSGSSQAMPESVQAQMEQSFGSSFSDVRVHENPAAASMGAAAFTHGSDIHFAPGRYQPHSSSGKQLLGHELSHVVQQREGRVQASGRANGVAVNTDSALESEADRAGSRVARGEAVKSSSAKGAAKSGDDVGVQLKAAASAPAVQFFFEGDLKGKTWRFADDLGMAVRQDSAVYGGRHFYAESGLISSASGTLKGQGSFLEMSAGGGSMQVTSPDGKESKTLSRVEPKNTSDGTQGNEKSGMMWPDDCGMAANAVMHGKGRTTKGVYTSYETVKQNWIQKVVSFFKGSKPKEEKKESETGKATYGRIFERYRGGAFTSPHQMMEEIFGAVDGQDFETAWKSYTKLSEKDRQKFDQRLGINEYALPEVGEAYVIVANKDEHLDMGVWNFHWGAVIMRAGGDSVTMENFAGSGGDAWDYQMYGPPSKKGQTFYEQQKSRKKHDGKTPEYGNNPTVIRARSGS